MDAAESRWQSALGYVSTSQRLEAQEMTAALCVFALAQIAIIATAGWQATAGCLILDALALLIAAAEGVRRLGVAGLLRWLAVRLQAGALAVEHGQAAWRGWTEPQEVRTGIEKAMEEA